MLLFAIVGNFATDIPKTKSTPARNEAMPTVENDTVSNAPKSTQSPEKSQGSTQFRNWSHNTGKFRVMAELVDYGGGKAKLRKQDGATIDVPFERLSEQDKEFVYEQLGKLSKPQQENN